MASRSWHLSEVEGWEVHKAASKACRKSWFFGWQFIISQKNHGILVSWKVLSDSNDDADVMLVAVALEGWVLASQDRRLFEQVPISPRICFWSSFRVCKPMGHRQVIHNTWVNIVNYPAKKKGTMSLSLLFCTTSDRGTHGLKPPLVSKKAVYRSVELLQKWVYLHSCFLIFKSLVGTVSNLATIWHWNQRKIQDSLRLHFFFCEFSTHRGTQWATAPVMSLRFFCTDYHRIDVSKVPSP